MNRIELTDGSSYAASSCASQSSATAAPHLDERFGLVLESCDIFLPPSEPKLGSRTIPGQTYTRGLAIDDLTLPQATGGAGTVRYRLTPAIPGLRFASGKRVLSGTATGAGTYRMTYRGDRRERPLRCVEVHGSRGDRRVADYR